MYSESTTLSSLNNFALQGARFSSVDKCNSEGYGPKEPSMVVTQDDQAI